MSYKLQFIVLKEQNQNKKYCVICCKWKWGYSIKVFFSKINLNPKKNINNYYIYFQSYFVLDTEKQDRLSPMENIVSICFSQKNYIVSRQQSAFVRNAHILSHV